MVHLPQKKKLNSTLRNVCIPAGCPSPVARLTEGRFEFTFGQ